MRFVMFYHSLISDWNHGNAHFLRGVATDLLLRGHEVEIFEPLDGWSRKNLIQDQGSIPLEDFYRYYPRELQSRFYDPKSAELDELIGDADVVVVHEWNDLDFIARVGEYKKSGANFTLLFHDTHHRLAEAPPTHLLQSYDGILAFGKSLADKYDDAWVWHEAADTRIFNPRANTKKRTDLVWIGNFGDDERTEEIREFLIRPVKKLGIRAEVYGVRYPDAIVRELRDAGIEWRGYLPNYRTPQIFAEASLTVHIPRRPYTEGLPGIPTIRVFEALACGIPLISAPWKDTEDLFRPGKDLLMVNRSEEMKNAIEFVLYNDGVRASLARHGRETIENRHTCRQRVDELLEIVSQIRKSAPAVLKKPAKKTWAFFGSSLVSAYWNGAATYYRGLIRNLSQLGYEITFFEPDAFDRQKNRDLENPSFANVVVYPPTLDGLHSALESARMSDIIVKASGVGIFDEELEREVAALKRPDNLIIFWDVDAPATLDRLANNPQDPFHSLVPLYDLIFTYGGGDPVVSRYQEFGARKCIPIYNALDRSTHYPVEPNPRFEATMGFLGNRLPDREKRVEEFFLSAVAKLPKENFILGGSGWQDKSIPRNLRYLGHIFTHEHNAFNSSVRAVLNISRESMANYGFSPATRVFEAAGAGACIITDKWDGIENFLKPEKEVLVVENSNEVVERLESLSNERARAIGQAALRRIRNEHTYAHRAKEVQSHLEGYC